MTRAINLDPMFVPTSLPEIEFDMIHFAGGELHPKLNNRIDYTDVDMVLITHRVKDAAGIIEIMMIHDALKGKGIKRFELFMPYLPYARQDRRCAEGEAFGLDVFAKLINSMGFETVHVFDAHSNVSVDLINNLHNISNMQMVRDAVNYYNAFSCYNHKGLHLIAPDKGSVQKCEDLMNSEIGFLDLIKCKKVRDPNDGSLSGFEVLTDDLQGIDCMIVDDICDGGGTFEGVAEELKKHNAGNLYLFVTHGIFSKGFDKLYNHFDVIYTTNCFSDLNECKVKQLKIRL